MLCKMYKNFKKFCIRVRLASMMRAPLPQALRFSSWDPIPLSAHRAF